MGDRKPAEDALALRGDLDQDFPLIEDVPVAADEAQGGQAVDEPDDRVVLELELPREGADRGEPFGRQALDRQEELVLLGLQPGAPGLPFAEGEEAADQMAEMRQALIIRLAEPFPTRWHTTADYIALRYKVKPEGGAVSLSVRVKGLIR